jgi:hypothetical protein
MVIIWNFLREQFTVSWFPEWLPIADHLHKRPVSPACLTMPLALDDPKPAGRAHRATLGAFHLVPPKEKSFH